MYGKDAGRKEGRRNQIESREYVEVRREKHSTVLFDGRNLIFFLLHMNSCLFYLFLFLLFLSLLYLLSNLSHPQSLIFCSLFSYLIYFLSPTSFLFVYLFVYSCFCLFINLFVCLIVCLFIHMFLY